MTLTDYVILAAPIAIGAMILATISGILTRAIQKIIDFGLGLFFECRELPGTDEQDLVLDYLVNKGKWIKFAAPVRFLMYRFSLKSDIGESTMKTIVGECKANSGIFWYKGSLLVYRRGMHTEHGNQSLDAIWALRGSVNWDALLIAAAEWLDSQKVAKGSRFQIYRHSGRIKLSNSALDNDAPSVSPSKDGGRVGEGYDQVRFVNVDKEAFLVNYYHQDEQVPLIERLSLSAEHNRLIADVKFFLNHREWHHRRSVPYQRGYGLFGYPGTGKTTLVRAIAENEGLPVHIFDLATMDNHDFNNAWSAVQKTQAPMAVLFEDFDTVFHGRENISKTGDLTFDNILNKLDGIEKTGGLLLFVTANEIEHIDYAMGRPEMSESGEMKSSRPGRIDMIIELPGLDYEGRLKMAMRIVEDPYISNEMAVKYENDTPAQFQERCIAQAKLELENIRKATLAA